MKLFKISVLLLCAASILHAADDARKQQKRFHELVERERKTAQIIDKWHPNTVRLIRSCRPELNAAKNYAIAIGSDIDYFMRWLSEYSDTESCANVELYAMTKAGQMGIAPRVIASHIEADYNNSWILMEAIAEKPWSDINWKSDAPYTMLATMLRKLHAIEHTEVPEGTVSISQKVQGEYLRNFVEIFRKYPVAYDGPVRELISLACDSVHQMRSYYDQQKRTHLVWGDALPCNLGTDGGSMYAFSFDHSYYHTEVLTDVGLQRMCLVSKERKERFLQDYFGGSEIDAPTRARFYLAESIIGIYFGMAYSFSKPEILINKLVQYATKGSHVSKTLREEMHATGFDRLSADKRSEFGAQLLAIALKKIQSPKFAESLALVQQINPVQ